MLTIDTKTGKTKYVRDVRDHSELAMCATVIIPILGIFLILTCLKFCA